MLRLSMFFFVLTLSACGRSELAVVKESYARNFQQWCEDKTIPKEQRKTVDRLFSISGASDCADANYRLLGSTDISLWGSGLTDFAPLSSLPQVQSLDLGNNPIETLISVPTLSSLRTLRINGSKVKSIEGIGRFVELRKLDVSDTPLLSLRGVEGVSKLRTLVAKNTAIASLAPLRTLTKLDSFEMDNCVNGVVPQNLDALVESKTYYQNLSLTRCGIRDASELQGIKQIANLNLSGNKISNLEFLTGTLELFRLYANDNLIQSVEVLQKFDRTLNEVHLRKNKVTDVMALGVLKYMLLSDSLSLQSNPIRKERCPTESINAPLNLYCRSLQ